MRLLHVIDVSADPVVVVSVFILSDAGPFGLDRINGILSTRWQKRCHSRGVLVGELPLPWWGVHRRGAGVCVHVPGLERQQWPAAAKDCAWSVAEGVEVTTETRVTTFASCV